MAYFPSLKETYEITMLCVRACVPFQFFNQWINFHEIWYERYPIGGHPNRAVFNILQSVTTTWQTHELEMEATLNSEYRNYVW